MSNSFEKRLILDWTRVQDVVPIEKHLSDSLPAIVQAKKSLIEGHCKGSEFTGWVKYVDSKSSESLSEVKQSVDRICAHSDALVVVGIGGSLLGTKAIYEALTHSFATLNPRVFHRRPLLFWAGHHLANDEFVELLDALELYSPSILVVSKSGGTTEPAMAFRILKKYLTDRFGEAEANQRIFSITDPDSGTLLKISKENHFPHYGVPPSVGGRYSVFTAVGLLPLAVAGINCEDLIAGSKQAMLDSIADKNNSFETNIALCYAAIRNILYSQNYKTEALCTWSPKLRGIAEWWKQLFGESDGKNNKGLFPASVQFTTDLHSMGQYFQEGERTLIATHLKVQDEYSLSGGSVKRKIKIPDAHMNDGFEFLTDSTLDMVQNEAQQGTFLAHADGGVPTLVWEIPELTAYWLGYWLYTNMFACGIAGIARGINPFDQPGVEAYKGNMFALLGKPGSTERGAQIRARLERGQRLRSLGLTTRK